MPTGTIGYAMQSAAPISTVRSRGIRIAATGLAFLSLLVLTRPYRGIAHDAEIYIGQALAAADPQGLGRDMLFAFDDQFQFTLWPAAARAFVGAFGADGAAAGLAAFGLAAWAVACMVLVRHLLPRALLVPALVAAATLSPIYGGFSVFRYAEFFATPRSLAEALVLASLACFLAGRRLAMAGCLAAATLLHPIMALPGIATAFVLTVGSARRGILLAGAAGLAGLAGAAAGLPVLSRLLVVPDPLWTAGLDANPYLFPSRWGVDAWCTVALQLATVLVARRSLPGPTRAVAGAIAFVGASALLAALVFGDLVTSLLVLQAQVWRALWLLALVSAVLLPAALVFGWRLGSAGSVAAAVLALAWLTPSVPLAAALGVAALAIDARARSDRLRFGPSLVAAAWIAVACLLVLFTGRRIEAAATLFGSTPSGAGTQVEIWGLWIPLLAVATLVAVRPRLAPSAPVAFAGATLLAGLAVVLGDGRSDFGRALDSGRPDPALVRLLPVEPGPILWLTTQPLRSWILAGRPNWASYQQGGPMVFSRPLALLWSDRMDRLTEAGLVDAFDRSPHLAQPVPSLHPGTEALATFCAAPDAPLAIVVPLTGHVVLPADVPFATYRLPVAEHQRTPGGGIGDWTSVDRHAVVTCRDLAARRRAGPGLRPGLDAG